MAAPFPPTAPTTLTVVIPAYVYQLYNDDQDILAWFETLNVFGQGYLDSVTALNLPVYTDPGITGLLLDWVGAGLYGIARPVLPSGQSLTIGPLDTITLDSLMLDDSSVTGSNQFFVTNDDIYKRILTWNLYKGDGFVFSIPWLKTRIMRFLLGLNGTAPNIDQTYPVGVSIGSNGAGTITLTGTDPTVSPIFQAAVEGGSLPLPFQISWDVVIA